MDTRWILDKSSYISIAVIFGLLSACNPLAPLKSDYSAWKGHAVSELTESWGEPDKTETLGNKFVAMTWVDQGGSCEYTFTVQDGQIVGHSESGC